jgi:hypothetical protein
MYYWSVGKDIHWSRAVLLNFLDTDLYERQGYDENPAQNPQRILGCFALPDYSFAVNAFGFAV